MIEHNTGHNPISFKKNIPILIVLSAMILTAVIRLRLLNIPLERDEGEYAYMAQLMLRGIPPYLKAYSMKFPGIYCVYALIIALFGSSIAAIHTGLIIVNAATTLMVFFLARRLFDPYTAAFAGAGFALLSLGRSVLGLAANAEHFVVFFIVAGLILLLKAMENERPGLFVLSGIFFGLGFITKQHSIFFTIFAAIYIAWYRADIMSMNKKILKRPVLLFILGAASPFILICAFFLLSGSFDKFWFWTVNYSRAYINRLPLSIAIGSFMERLGNTSLSALPVWFAAAVGAGVLWRRKNEKPSRVFVLLLLLFSFLAVFPGFTFREHYFIFVLPVISILAGVAMKMLCDALLHKRSTNGVHFYISVGLCIGILLYPVINERTVFFTLTPQQVSRTIYGSNPFQEAVEISKYLKENSGNNKTVAVFGSEPEIYFYLDRIAPTGYIYMYPLMEDQPYSFRMQEEMKHEIETASPDYLVFVNLMISWTDWVILEKEHKFFQWFDKYYKTYYETVGVVNIVSKDKTEYVWGDTAKSYAPRTPYVIYILKRKNV